MSESRAAGYQMMVEAESVDEFVHSQTTRKTPKYQQDVNELNDDECHIDRFIRAGEKNRFTNVACYDEILDATNKDFYVHANTFRTPHGNFIVSQAPHEKTAADHFDLMWMYNVRTVVCLVPPEEAGGYFELREGATFTVFKKYSMKTMAIFDEKQGLTVYQCELRSHSAPAHLSRRFVYIVCCETAVAGVRSPRQQSVLMEYVWSLEEAERLAGGPPTTVLVHGLSGTRRCTSFVCSLVMCRQILETGKFAAMETWIEMRRRRAHSCGRKHDFYSSLYTVFTFCAQCCAVAETDEHFVKSVAIIKTLLEQRENREKQESKQQGGEKLAQQTFATSRTCAAPSSRCPARRARTTTSSTCATGSSGATFVSCAPTGRAPNS